jgi:hypothetical protein
MKKTQPLTFSQFMKLRTAATAPGARRISLWFNPKTWVLARRLQAKETCSAPKTL